MQTVIITHLQMLSPSELREKPSPTPDFRIAEAKIKNWRLHQFFYTYVGSQWSWTDKSKWSEEQWRRYVERDSISLFIAYLCDTPVGYFELERKADEVEIVLLGLEPTSVSKGLGGHLVSEAIRHAWLQKPQRVIVNTCTLDHPYALQNYLARGMTIYKKEEKTPPS